MKEKRKRKVEIAVVSDVHLGTFGCRAEELLNYLKSIDPDMLIINGDFVDIWQFNKRYFPTSHMKVVKYITSLLSKGKKIYYVTGNHDEMLRKFEGFRIGGFEIVNKLVLDLHGKKAWIFHGDIFDVVMKNSKWLAKLGGIGYDVLILINAAVNQILRMFGKGRISFSKRIKNSVKGAVKHINNFENVAAEIAIQKGYDYVVCGHIHQPVIKDIRGKGEGKVKYLNSGDWVENMTALEYHRKKWSIYKYMSEPQFMLPQDQATEQELLKVGLKNRQLFDDLLAEFELDSKNKNNL